MKTRYIPFVHQPFCCVPATIQMILYRRNLKLLSQEEIGCDLGLIIPKEYYEILPNARRGSKPASGWGTQLQEERFSLNSFFEKHDYPLIYEYKPLDSFDENLIDWLKGQLEKEEDVIVCFNARKLWGVGNDGGHVCVVENVDGDYVNLIETNCDYPKFRKVKFSDLVESMKYHGERNLGGFWLIRD